MSLTLFISSVDVSHIGILSNVSPLFSAVPRQVYAHHNPNENAKEMYASQANAVYNKDTDALTVWVDDFSEDTVGQKFIATNGDEFKAFLLNHHEKGIYTSFICNASSGAAISEFMERHRLNHVVIHQTVDIPASIKDLQAIVDACKFHVLYNSVFVSNRVVSPEPMAISSIYRKFFNKDKHTYDMSRGDNYDKLKATKGAKATIIDTFHSISDERIDQYVRILKKRYPHDIVISYKGLVHEYIIDVTQSNTSNDVNAVLENTTETVG